MKIGFKDWRECSQNIIAMNLNISKVYYMQARAWHLKGYLGGTHSYTTFYSHQHKCWMVVEYSDRETLSYQGGKIIYDGNNTLNDSKRAVYITTRPFNIEWFGAAPYIVDYCDSPDYGKVLSACQQYPYDDFRIIDLNCNTFTSYLHWKIDLNLKRPLRSIGYRSKKWWNINHCDRGQRTY